MIKVKDFAGAAQNIAATTLRSVVGDMPLGGRTAAAILRAEGFSNALQRIFDVAHGVDANTMSLQYLEALKQIGLSPSTKFVIPMEFSTLLANVVGGTARSFGIGIGNGNGSGDAGLQ